MRVALYVTRGEFANTLGEMREWLDSHKCPDGRFETATKAGVILISIELPSDLGAPFLQAFDPIAAAA